jgi:acyl dehydratase
MPVCSGGPFPQEWFEDFALDQVFDYGAYAVTEAAILAFGREFDPEPFHVDKDFALASPFKGLIASGLHTAAIWRRVNRDAFPKVRSGASPGWDELRFKSPVRPGDTLRMRTTIAELKPSKSRPRFGLVRLFNETLAGAELRMTHYSMFLCERRPD